MFFVVVKFKIYMIWRTFSVQSCAAKFYVNPISDGSINYGLNLSKIPIVFRIASPIFDSPIAENVISPIAIV